MKRIIIDLDDTIAMRAESYENSVPNEKIIKRLREYKAIGFEIAIFSSRNVRTYSSNIGKINANTLPVIVDWLNRNDVPYDEIYVGKPWCGTEGFYVDDKAIRPNEFAELSYSQICELIGV